MRITFRLKVDRDDDLLHWFKALGEGERSFFIRQAFRRGLSNNEEVVSIPVISDQHIKPVKEDPITPEEAESRLSILINNF